MPIIGYRLGCFVGKFMVKLVYLKVCVNVIQIAV